MELEAVRIVADWLAYGINGRASGVLDGAGSVNALLPAVPRDAGDPQPAAVTVCESTRDGWVARLTRPAEGLNVRLPSLAVFVQDTGEYEGEVKTVLRDGTIPIAVMYVDENHDAPAALAASLYTGRAVMRSLRLLNDPSRVAQRMRNDITLWRCEKMLQVRGGVVNGLVLSNGIIASYHVRDSAP